MLRRETRGIPRRRRRVAPDVVMRAEGSGREGLLIASSLTASGRRWLERVKRRVLSQVQRRMWGIRETVDRRLGLLFVVMTGPERAPKRPKALSGMTKVFKSLRVKSKRVSRK